MSQAYEFDFVEDENGEGRFVTVGGPLENIRALLARQDVEGAVKLYEETAGSCRQALVAEATSGSFELKKTIGTLLKRARDFSAAGQVFELGRMETEAAQCFEMGDDFARAAPVWKRLGELLRAAGCSLRAGKAEEALQLYQQAGAAEGVAESLSRLGRSLEAAQAWRALNNPHAESEVLRAGLVANPANLPLAVQLADLLLRHGRGAVAVQTLTDAGRVAPTSRTDVLYLETLARAFDAAGSQPSAEKVRAHLATLPRTAATASAPSPVPVVVGRTPPALAPADDGYGFLKALPLFAELSLTDMKALYRVCARATFEPGQHLIEVGRPGRGLFIIIDGQVEVYSGPEPTARLLNTLGTGGYIGEISLVQDGPTTARVTARSAVKALFISRDAFLTYLVASPAAALSIWRLFALNLSERVRVLSAAR
jgi:tetratricopeptide (TPR) repeat protein